MKRQQILDQYATRDGLIISPGKFEGEPIFVPALWELAIDGFSDGDDGKVYRFNIRDDDELRTKFPELSKWLGRKRIVRLREDSQGFVHAF
jgi:hypothetical protein